MSTTFTPAIPDRVSISEIEDFDNVDLRRSAIDCLYGNVISVGDTWAELCTDEGRRSVAHQLAWWWFVKPSLGEQMRQVSGADFVNLVDHYDACKMGDWFEKTAT